MSNYEFQTWKGIAIASTLLFVVLTQIIHPYKKDMRSMLKSWLTNFPLAVFNLLLISAFCQGCVCAVARWSEDRGIGVMNAVPVPSALRVGVGLLVLDFVAYAWHRANHKFRFLWRFHAVHHSDQFLDASTAFRFHPGEIVISLVARIAVVVIFGISVPGILLFEIAYVFFNLFEHGNIRLSSNIESTIENIFLTPALHRKHHSVVYCELNSNFGTIFSFWDRTFGTRLSSSSEDVVSVGLPKGEEKLDLWSLLKMPFRF